MTRTETASVDPRTLEAHFEKLVRQATADLAREGFGEDRLKLTRAVAMRYVGQSFEIDISWGKRFEEAFHSAHRERYGYSDNSRPTEIVSLRLRAAGITDKPSLGKKTSGGHKTPTAIRSAKVCFTARAIEIPVYSRDELKAGMRLNGPAVVTEYSSTTLIPPGRRVETDPWLNLIITNN